MPTEPSITPDPVLTPLALVAATAHEMYVEFQAAGFTRDEALDLIVRFAK